MLFWWWSIIECKYSSKKIIYLLLLFLLGSEGSNLRLSALCRPVSSLSSAKSTMISWLSSMLPCLYRSSNKMALLCSSPHRSTDITIPRQMPPPWTYPVALTSPLSSRIPHLSLLWCRPCPQRNASQPVLASGYPSSKPSKGPNLTLFHFFEPKLFRLPW